MLSCEYCEIFKNTYFEEHLQIAASLMNGCFWKPCLFEFIWTISRILMSWCQSKVQNNILKIFNKILPHRIGNDLCSENTKFCGNRVFVFQLEAFQFSKFHENVAKLDKGHFKRGKLFTNVLRYLKFENYQNFKKFQKISKEKTVNFGQAIFFI